MGRLVSVTGDVLAGLGRIEGVAAERYTRHSRKFSGISAAPHRAAFSLTPPAGEADTCARRRDPGRLAGLPPGDSSCGPLKAYSSHIACTCRTLCPIDPPSPGVAERLAPGVTDQVFADKGMLVQARSGFMLTPDSES